MSEREEESMALGPGAPADPAGSAEPRLAESEPTGPANPEPADPGPSEPAAAAGELEPSVGRQLPGGRPTDLVVARLHLRVGLLGMARSELETLAGSAELDLPGILDLAEARWRTGDLRGAGEAAAAYLALAARGGLEPEGPVAHAIVAEAAALRGHDAEAAEAVAGAITILRAELDDPAALEPALDRLFAGIPPRGPWPEPEEARVAPVTMPRRLPWQLPSAEIAAEADQGTGVGSAEGPPEQVAPSPAVELLGEGLDALAASEPGRAAVALGLALRSDPGSAPDVIAAVEEAGALAGATGEAGADASSGRAGSAPDPGRASLAVVQGDALRAAGRDDEAALSYDLARRLAASGDEAAAEPETPPAVDQTQPPPASDEPGSGPLPGG